MAKPVGRRREVPTPELRCPTCGAELERFWSHCSNCGRRLEWRDTQKATGAECYYCGWIVSDAFSFCPWCGRDITDEASSPEPLKAQGLELPRAAPAGCVGCDAPLAQGHRDRAALRHWEAVARRDLVEHAHRPDLARARPLVSVSQLVVHAHRPVPPRLRRSAQG